MKKIILILGGALLLLVLYKTVGSGLPEYNPERSYVNLETEILEAFILAKDSATIELSEGHFLFSQSLSMDGKKHITIRGKGMDKTVLSFKGQTKGAEGILITNCNYFTIEDLTIEDAVGDNLKISESKNVTIRNVRTAWTGTISTQNGAYGIYPVLTKNLLIEGCEAIGASDAGIYVGQSKNVVVRNNRAFYNVAGIESENSTGVEIHENDIYENTSGLLIFNLPKLTLYGKNITAYNNRIYNNNIKNFGVKGSIISGVPKGTGVIIMATQNVNFYNNTIEDHVTNNLSVVSYLVFAAKKEAEAIINQSIQDRGIRAVETDYESDTAYNPYPGNVSIHNNIFKNKFWFPTLSNEYGWLMLFKNKATIPDVVYDGILPEGASLQDDEHKICIGDNGTFNFVFMDAAHDFDAFSNDVSPYTCTLDL
ncbi:right-handed parallel beta-helix repeat-containing protein [Flavobacteriaceae bacterium]|nr:right-handed parallel beta-helix repeat-containing protein [Flavobacteriaceae bacterium]